MKDKSGDYMPKKEYPNGGANVSGSSKGASKVSTVITTNENPNDGMKPNAGKGPKHSHASY